MIRDYVNIYGGNNGVNGHNSFNFSNTDFVEFRCAPAPFFCYSNYWFNLIVDNISI